MNGLYFEISNEQAELIKNWNFPLSHFYRKFVRVFHFKIKKVKI